MKKYAIIILGFISIMGSCSKTVSVRLKLLYGDSLVVGNWMQLSGPTNLVFSTLRDSAINIATNGKPTPGVYIIQAVWGKDTASYAYPLK